jgi:hypothetical protein
MIKLFCKNLPRNLSNLLYNEYNSYEKELKFLLNTYRNRYAWTNEIDFEYLQIFLSLAIFYRRIIVKLDSAVDFSERFLFSENIKGIVIGNYLLSKAESEKLNTIVNDFKLLCGKYNISNYLFDFENITQFLFKFREYNKNIGISSAET